MKRFKHILKLIGGGLMFLLTGKGEVANKGIRDGIISYEGQGRDAYGR